MNKQNIISGSQNKDISKKFVLQYLHDLELKNDVKIIYASETGSRAFGTNVFDSDFDVKGYFIGSPKQYMSIKGCPEIITNYHQVIEVDGNKLDIDFEFHDIKNFFKQKIQTAWKPNLNYKFFTEQQDIYINLFEDDHLNIIKSQLNLDNQLWISILKGYHKQFLYLKPSKKDQQKQEENFDRNIKAKDIVNFIVYLCQYFYILENQQFPPYKIKDLQLLLKQNNNTHYLQNEETINSEYQKYFKLKQENRLNYVWEGNFSPELVELMEMSYSLAKTNDKKQFCKNIEFTEEQAEQIFNELLQKLF